MEYNVIDADGHILEPPDLWENYIDPKFREICPKVLVTENGGEILRIEGDDAINLGRGKKPIKLGGLGTFGARAGGVNSFRVAYLEGKRGGFDPHARIPDMDAEGIDAAFLYPSLGLFLGATKDPEFPQPPAAHTTAGWRIIANPIRLVCLAPRCCRCNPWITWLTRWYSR